MGWSRDSRSSSSTPGVADYEEPVPAEQVIDRSFVGEAVGIPRDAHGGRGISGMERSDRSADPLNDLSSSAGVEALPPAVSLW
jgi:hypothetical protein